MPKIEIKTIIKAKRAIVFDLSRSIDLHKISTERTKEKAIGGVVSGLIGNGESVTWQAKHFGVYQKLTSKITVFNRPEYFADEMQRGVFKSFKHQHHFKEKQGETILLDVFEYTSPFGILGRLADILFLENYMKKFLMERNKVIKEFAESTRWKKVLNIKETRTAIN